MNAFKRFARLAAWKAIFALPERDVVLATANGSLAVRNKDWLIGKKLYVDRGFESEEIDAWVTGFRAQGWLPPRRATIVDPGANIGMISIAMLLRGHFREAIAFEPAPDPFRLLTGNLARNGLGDQVRAVRLALSSSEGNAALGLSPDNSGDNRVEEGAAGPGQFREERRARIRVPTTTLDAWLPGAGIDPREIGLLWLDTQGFEAHALSGACSLLGRVPVVVEIWPYALERSGCGLATLAKLATELTGGLQPSPGAAVQDPRDLPGFAESLGPSPRAMAQIALAPRAGAS